MPQLDRSAGRTAFGADPAGYAAARPDYPAFVYEVLAERCGLAPGCAAFEIGAGTGMATRRLQALGAEPLVAIEPDGRLAAHLRRTLPGASIVEASFEDWRPAAGAFDLGAAATAFHWLDEPSALRKIASALKAGGWWAAWWNVFGDPDRADPFHEATLELLADQGSSPADGEAGRPPFALDQPRRLGALAASGLFEPGRCELERWTLRLSPPQVRALYATYSGITTRPDAEAARVLDGLEAIAQEQFGGAVERNMITILYTARTKRR